MARKHVVITGTGRCGTTFLVELLTNLGLDTGFDSNEIRLKKNAIAHAGLEYDIRDECSPYIVKSPWFCDHAEEVISRNDIVIEHVFVPVRDIFEAAESRRQVYKKNMEKMPLFKKLTRDVKHALKLTKTKRAYFDGGLVHTRSLKKGRQEEILLRQIYNLLFTVADTDIPVTLMKYPRIVNDCEYLFERLKPVLGEMDYDAFSAVFAGTVQRELVHSYRSDG